MKKTRKIVTVLTAALLSMCSIFSACGTTTQGKKPDYSSSEKEYTFWAYSQTCDDWYQVNGERFYFEDGTRQTLENTKLCADAGFNVLFIDWTFPYQGPSGYADSKVKTVLDYAYEAGMKAFVFASDLHRLSATEESLINAEKADGVKFFESEAALDKYVADYLAPIIEHPAFYGVSLRDEPKWQMLEAIGQVYRAVQKAAPGAWCNMNINPMYEGLEHMYCPEGNSVGVVTAYKKYLDLYYEHIGQYCGYIQYDDYPILKDGAILSYHLQNAQIVAEYCKEKGMQFGKVFQTCAYDAELVRVTTTKTDMLWQLNIGMAMGIKDYSYYTYYPTVNLNEAPPDLDAFIVTREGKPLERYYWLKDMHEEMQFNAKALMNFEYQALNYAFKTPIPGNKSFLAGVKSQELTDIKKVTLDSAGVVLTTEQYDKANDRRGYYVMNVTAPSQVTEIKVTLEISGYKNVQIYNGKTVTEKKVKNGTVSFYLSTGEGVFVIPY
ncbi:MAG: hypothetical protein IJX09_03945 [Clostridia bacterium]|nr:hypothetical protein [Clostridia bacterium]